VAADAVERGPVRGGVPPPPQVSTARAFSWRAELSRKGIHLASSIFPVAWGFGWVAPAVVKGALAAVLGIAVALEFARRGVPAVQRWFLAWFGGMLRGHEVRALTGATWILAAMLLCALLLPPRAAISALWAGVVGDAAAALIGRALASRAASEGKTWVGSAACAAASAIGPWWLAAASPFAALGIGLAAALAERPQLAIDDNARVAVAAGLAAWGLGVA
jgi:dolichol kinase